MICRLPPPLDPTAGIGIVAPASTFRATELDVALDYLHQRGHPTTPGQALADQCRYLAGTDDARRLDLEVMFRDPAIGAILCARGGYGSARLLDQLDWELIRKHPKPFVGFSDLTALQLAMCRHAELCSYTGFVLCADVGRGAFPPALERSLWAALYDRHWPVVSRLTCQRPGQAAGPLYGGCLSLLCSLLGTAHLPDLSGALLFIEDVGEPAYRVDRMLNQLRQAGILQQLAGLLYGSFDDGTDLQESAAIREVTAEYARLVPGPVVRDLPYGHYGPRLLLPMGRPAQLDAKTGTLRVAGG